jgi:uncharacterized peroxidase-related enzyme
MSRLPTLGMSQLPDEVQALIEQSHRLMGFTPNDALTMARNPALLQAFAQLVQVIYQPGELSSDIKRLAGLMTSVAAGCQYCKAHTSFSALNAGIDAAKLDALWEYQTSPLFSDAERAALDVARFSAMTPNAVSDQHFQQLRLHFSTNQIIELVSLLSLFAFLNRWNATFKTDIEASPQRA